ncbi:hypothetical protein NT01EI_0985 [Edwardsiella ictaluri 93-146]|uniref:Uncharacterized protein n=1 Tax=Edwardsiella ictaluri (strain 93-146) TaxID=634503 RepID=C5BBG3_EDWI9|nr:hypothetical protein NT01EI_0985 [Edwardsiella ictaluri 93-146]
MLSAWIRNNNGKEILAIKNQLQQQNINRKTKYPIYIIFTKLHKTSCI